MRYGAHAGVVVVDCPRNSPGRRCPTPAPIDSSFEMA
jgi:hypothetical protein